MESLAILRSADDLSRTCDDLTEFFAFLRRQESGAPFSADGLLGIWIDRQMAALPPAELAPVVDGAGRPIRIVESVSLAEVWTLCRLAVGEGDRLSRRELLEALVESSAQEDRPGWFIPIFVEDGGAQGAAAELERLPQKYLRHILEPLCFEPVGGQLVPLRQKVEGK